MEKSQQTYRQRSWRLKERFRCEPCWQSPQQEGRTVAICSDYTDKIRHVEKASETIRKSLSL